MYLYGRFLIKLKEFNNCVKLLEASFANSKILQFFFIVVYYMYMVWLQKFSVHDISSHNSIQRKNRRIRYLCKKRNLLYKHICMNYNLKYLINEWKSNKITWCYTCRCTSEIFPLFTYQCSAGVASSPLAQWDGFHWNAVLP